MLLLSLRVLLHRYHAGQGLWHQRRRCLRLVLTELVLEWGIGLRKGRRWAGEELGDEDEHQAYTW